MSRNISRRTVLRGLGTAVALPFLEGMLPGALGAAPAAAKKAPKRMAFFYVPNGVNVAEWKPKQEGAGFELPSILRPLTPFKDQLLVLTGLTADKARANGDGPGDHARALSAFLTGRQPKKTHGADIRVGISVDQLAAQRVGRFTRFASLELGCERGQQAGNCDSGYSCAYSSNISWRTESTPVGKEVDPKLVFDRLFSNGVAGETAEAKARRDLYNKSILDFVAEDANRLKTQLGATDQRKLDEYLSGVRELELRLNRATPNGTADLPKDFSRPAGVPKDFGEHMRLLSDLLVLAFQGDLTRVSTFVVANEGSNRPYRNINISDGHHELSHHQRDPKKLEKIRQINLFHMEQFAYFLSKLEAVKEGDGTLLDHCMILYGSGNGDGNRHNHDDLPILLLGKGGGTLRPGRHVVYPNNTPLTNLFVEMLDRVGVRVPSFGDSTGRLPSLTV